MVLKTLLNKLFHPDEFHKQNQYVESMILNERSAASWLYLRPTMVNGTICVRDGKVIITDPQNDGSYATILAPENPLIQIYVDGKRVFGEVVVNKSSSAEVHLSSVKPTISYEAVVSEDELQVSVRTKVVHGRKLSLKESEPRRRLEIEIEETYTEPLSASAEDILKLISENGYIGTVDYDAINRLCYATDNEEEIVLRGIAPTSGHSAKLRASNSLSLEYDSLLHVYRSPIVSIGTPVAVLEHRMEGTVGKNVYGVAIPVTNKGAQPELKLGYGVIHVNQDIVAIREGRPRFTKHMLDVIPELVLDRDISVEDGTVSFEGNIIVHGSIRDGAIIKASGAITVYGSIEQSSIFAGQGVFVQEGIHRSKVVSGYQQILCENLLDLLAKMIPELKRFKEEYSLMVAHAIKRFDASVAIPKIPSLLFERRHETLNQMLGMFVNDHLSDLSEFDGLYRELKELVDSTWRGDHRFKVSQRDMEIILDKMESFSDKIQSLPKEFPVIRAMYVTSSMIESVGNIIVTGNSYSSTLESRRTVAVHRSLRGGFAVAKKSIYVGELGNPSGIETSVRVDNPNGFICIKLNHINTLLEVNGRRWRTYDEERDIRFGGN